MKWQAEITTTATQSNETTITTTIKTCATLAKKKKKHIVRAYLCCCLFSLSSSSSTPSVCLDIAGRAFFPMDFVSIYIYRFIHNSFMRLANIQISFSVIWRSLRVRPGKNNINIGLAWRPERKKDNSDKNLAKLIISSYLCHSLIFLSMFHSFYFTRSCRRRRSCSFTHALYFSHSHYVPSCHTFPSDG